MRRCAASTFALVVLAAGASAQDGADLPAGVTSLGPVAAEFSQRYRFESENVGKAFVIDVVQVNSLLTPPGGRLPVVFVTDNDAFATLAPSIVRGGAGELFPSMIVVGIGYAMDESAAPLDRFVQFGVRRAVDFTPSVDEAYLAQVAGALQAAFQASWPDGETLGGADAFLAFIDEELKPFIAARYPADIEDSTIIGHSMGGLFALHVLFTSPESFDRYIAISPAANYDDGVLFREEAALGDVSARVFMAVGGQDIPDIREAVPRLDAQITATARPSLRYSYRLFEGETHSSVVPGGIMSGLRAVFDPPPPPPGFAPPPPAQDGAPQ